MSIDGAPEGLDDQAGPGNQLDRRSPMRPQAVAQVAYDAGVPCGRRLVEAVAVAYAESSWIPTAKGYNSGSTDHGLWQINDYYWGPFTCDIYSPRCNADYMVQISSGGSDWGPWYGHGTSLYYDALDDAEAAERAVCSCTSYAGTFSDDDGSIHEANIEAIAAAGITAGCQKDPCPKFCPGATLRRDEMASFLARGLNLPNASRDYFTDDDGNVHEGAINKVAEAGITLGCNPPQNSSFCPGDDVSRGQMASFLARALELPAASRDHFDDDDSSPHEGNINKIAEAGITRGCNQANTAFCPNDSVTRAQTATLLARALGL